VLELDAQLDVDVPPRRAPHVSPGSAGLTIGACSSATRPARIASGEVDTAFRRQRRPTVKAGGTLRTMIGMLAIDAVDRIAPGDVTEADAQRAGMTRDEILAMLAARTEGDCYRVRLHVAGEDPRLALREDASLDDATVARARLDRLDAASRGVVVAADLAADCRAAVRPSARLAASMGHDTPSFRRTSASRAGPDGQPRPRLRARSTRPGTTRSALIRARALAAMGRPCRHEECSD
jgi:hypothetical protein